VNSRQRFHAVANGHPVDQTPFFEEEIRDDVLQAWRAQGMPAWVTTDVSRRFFCLDRIETIPVRFSPTGGELKSRSDFKRIMRSYEQQPVKFLSRSYWEEKARQYHDRDFPLGLTGWNGFQLPFFPPNPNKEHNEWDNLVNLYLQMKDNPDAVKEALSFIAEYYVSIVRLARSYVDFDFVVISEPIATVTGPVISPTDFAYFCLPYYPKLAQAYRKMGIPKVMFSSIGNVGVLLPAIAASGVDGMKITQLANTGIDYVQVSQQYPDLFLLGGLDATALLRNRQAIVQDVKHKALPLLKRGRWLPALDDTVRVNVPYRRFQTYRKAVEEYTTPRQAPVEQKPQGDRKGDTTERHRAGHEDRRPDVARARR
jgi:hypothetical protein